MIVLDNTPIAMLTVGQLKEVFAPYMAVADNRQSKERHYAYGLRGLAKIFDCSIPTAQRIKASGMIDGAIVQTGRKIVVDVDRAIELAGRNK